MSNFIFNAGTIYYGEVIEIVYNNELIFRHTMDSVERFPHCFQYYSQFALPYSTSFSISISTSFKGKKYIDTTVTGSKGDYGYHLNLSRSLPLDWDESYFEKGRIEAIKTWGYLPIDSCIRLVKFEVDTIYKNTWRCNSMN